MRHLSAFDNDAGEHKGHCPRLLGRVDNKSGWQHEAIAARVTQLNGVRVLDADVLGPIVGSASGRIQYDAGCSNGVLLPVECIDGLRKNAMFHVLSSMSILKSEIAYFGRFIAGMCQILVIWRQ